MNQAKRELLAKLITTGVPLPIALSVVLSDDPVGDISEGLATFNKGANAVLDTVANPKKAKRKASAYSKRYKAAFKTESKKHKTKSGKWKRGGFLSLIHI